MLTRRDLGRVLGQTLPARPRLPSWAGAVDVGDGRLQLRSPRSVLTLRDPLLSETFRRLEEHLDGSSSVQELRERGGDGIRPATVEFLLKTLRTYGFLEEAAVPPDLDPQDVARYDPQLRVLGQLGAEPLVALSQLKRAAVALVGHPSLTVEVAEALEECAVTAASIDSCDSVDGCDLVVGCFGLADLAAAKRANADCVRGGVRLLPLLFEGPTASLGPTVIPRETACLQCLEDRVTSTRPRPDEWSRYRHLAEAGVIPEPGLLAPLLRTVASQAALEAVRLLTSVSPPATIGTVLVYSVQSPLTDRQTVLKSPHCAVCGRKVPAPAAWDTDLSSLDPPP